MGGLTRAQLPNSDSFKVFYSSDIYVFKPSSKSWAYVLGSYGECEADTSNARPSVPVMLRSALSWTSNSLRLYIHSNPVFQVQEIYDMLPLVLEPLQQPEWWDYDITTHALVRLNRFDSIQNSQRAQVTWSDAKYHYAITENFVSASEISSGLTILIPLTNFPNPTFAITALDHERNGEYTRRTVAQPWIVTTSVHSVRCGNRVYLFGSVNRKRVYGYIDQNDQRATFIPLSIPAGVSVPRPITGGWVWKHPENGFFLLDGRLPYDHPQHGAELRRKQKETLAPDCVSLRP